MHAFMLFAAQHESLFTLAATAAIIYPLIVFKRIHDLQLIPKNGQYLQDDAGLSLATAIVKHCGWPTAITVYGGIMAALALMLFPAIASAFIR